MPYKREWIEPEIVASVNGITVYRHYKNEEYYNAYCYHFKAVSSCVDSKEVEDYPSFDVRELSTYEKDRYKVDAIIKSLGYDTPEAVADRNYMRTGVRYDDRNER